MTKAYINAPFVSSEYWRWITSLNAKWTTSWYQLWLLTFVYYNSMSKLLTPTDYNTNQPILINLSQIQQPWPLKLSTTTSQGQQ